MRCAVEYCFFAGVEGRALAVFVGCGCGLAGRWRCDIEDEEQGEAGEGTRQQKSAEDRRVTWPNIC